MMKDDVEDNCDTRGTHTDVDDNGHDWGESSTRYHLASSRCQSPEYKPVECHSKDDDHGIRPDDSVSNLSRNSSSRIDQLSDMVAALTTLVRQTIDLFDELNSGRRELTTENDMVPFSNSPKGSHRPRSRVKRKYVKPTSRPKESGNGVILSHIHAGKENREPNHRKSGNNIWRTFVNGKNEACLLDSGCDITVFPKRIITDSKIKPTDQRINNADGSYLDLVGEADAIFFFF